MRAIGEAELAVELAEVAARVLGELRYDDASGRADRHKRALLESSG